MTELSIPDQRGRVVLLTGGNSGIGYAAARELARAGAHVLLACRDPERARAAVDALRAELGVIQVEPVQLDLADFASVRACAAAFLSRGLPLHVLIDNAGLGGKRKLTASGFEPAFGVNHMGHFLLTTLLLDRLRESAPARVVTVASHAHYRVHALDFAALRRPARSFGGIHEYSVSKLCNVLFSAELGRRLAGTSVHTYSLHPGVIATGVWRRVPQPVRWLLTRRMLSPEQGAKTTLYCATSAACANETGLYYDLCATREPSELARDAALARRLWEQSEAWIES